MQVPTAAYSKLTHCRKSLYRIIYDLVGTGFEVILLNLYRTIIKQRSL